MNMAVRKSTRDGLKNMANDDVIRQAQLKLEMMSNEQFGPIQMAMMLKQQYHISDMLCGPPTTVPDPGGGGGYGHEINDRDVTNMLKVNRSFEPSPDDILAWVDECYEVFTTKVTQNLDFDEDKTNALQSKIDEACEIIKEFQLLFPHPALNKLLFDLNELKRNLQKKLIDIFLENNQLDRYGGAREGPDEAPLLIGTNCRGSLEDDFVQCACKTAHKFCVKCCPFQEPENSHGENNESEYFEPLTLFTEIKAMLYSIVLPQDELMKEMIEDALDVNVIKQQIDGGVLEFDKYAGRILVLMEILCEPARDEQIAALKQMTKVIPLFRGIMQTLEDMKQDMANLTVQTVRGTTEKDDEDMPDLSGMDDFLDLSNVPAKQPDKIEKSIQILYSEYNETREEYVKSRNKDKELTGTEEDSPCSQNVVKEMQTELSVDETYEDSVNNHIVNNNKDKGLAGTKEYSPGVVDGNSEDEMPDAKLDQELTENNDNEGVDVNDKNSSESNAEVDGTNEEEVYMYNDTLFEENDGQMSDKVNEATLDEVENFAVDMKNDSKATLEHPNEFIEPEVKRNVVKLLFEGTFLENSKEIIENLNKFPKPEVNVKEITPQIAMISNTNNKVDADRAAVRVNLAFRKLSAAAVAGKKGAGSYKLAATKKKAKKHAKKAKKPAAKKRADKPKAEKPSKKAKKPTKKADKIPAVKKAANNSVMIREHDFNMQCSMVAKPNSQLMNVIRLDFYKIKISFPWNPGVSLGWICCYATMYITLQMLFQPEEC